MADAGRAMMLYRGLYDSTYTYEKLDVVNHNGSLYISTTDGNLGTEPTEETKWKLFLQGGVADNMQATDTHGLVGEAGGSSFVQLLLDSLASRVGKDGNGNVIEDTYIPQNATLNTLEEIDANTSEGNIAGALAVKSLKSNFENSISKLKVYFDIKDISTDLDWSTATFNDIYSAMPRNSVAYLSFEIDSQVVTEYGFLNGGTIQIYKSHEYRGMALLSIYHTTDFRIACVYGPNTLLFKKIPVTG